MMNKLTIATFLIFCSNLIFAQTEPRDTTYYDQSNNIKSIFFDSDFFTTGNKMIRYYKKEGDILGPKLVDTVFWWGDHYDQTRFYLRDSISIHKAYGYKDKYYKKLYLANYRIWLQGKKGIRDYEFRFNKDSVLNEIYIGITNPNNAYRNEITYVHLSLNGGLGYSRTGHEFSMGNNEYTKLYFHKDCRYSLKRLIYFNDNIDSDLSSFSLTFYPDLVVKEFGDLINGNKVGIWKEFHINGKLKSIGEYFPSHTVDEINMKYIFHKDKLWHYYNNEGLLIREEKWDKGKLISTTIKNR